MLKRLRALIIQLKPYSYVVVTHSSGVTFEVHLYPNRKNAVLFKASDDFKIERKLYENSTRD